jgi:aminocarboxymuconate-semialdehyde decarboxylase
LNHHHAHAPQAAEKAEGTGIGVDIHAHYYPQAYLDLIAAEGGDFGARYVAGPDGPSVRVGPLFAGPIRPKFIDIDLRVAAMDEQKVKIQTLSLTQPMVYWAGDALSRRLTVAFNDALVAANERHPARLYGIAILPAQQTALALAEIERLAGNPSIRGFYMGTRVAERELSDLALWPIYERIESLGLPIFLHPVEVIGMTDRLTQYFLSNILGNPFDTAIAAAHLIFGGVLDRFPRLDVVLPHAGGALPFLIGRIKHGWRVRPECAHLTRSPEEYMPRFYYDTITHSPEALRYLIDRVGASRILLGSDYCFDMGYERPVDVILDHPGLTRDEREQILGGNARNLLGLLPAEHA